MTCPAKKGPTPDGVVCFQSGMVPGMEVISNEELQLAGSLRQLCNTYGEERRSTLTKSGEVFLKMGKLYSGKAVSTSGMLQKLTFIRSSALLVGAKVRFSLKSDSKSLHEVHHALNQLSDKLLTASHSKANANVFSISEEAYQLLSKMRAEENSKVDEIPLIHEDILDDAQLLAKEEEKTMQVQNVMESATQNYMNLMRFIAGRCLDLLGSAPFDCKFAMVGVGSLARREITLYSDFEHVIVLDDSAQHRSGHDIDRVKEYFRWFAVLFQCVIIGLGETFIRSVGVKSINDLYSDDKSKNWYFDHITPCGIAFDGMVPHSSMNPLGRMIETKYGRPLVEFIQSTSKMANFLTHDEEVKNGYYVKDILSRTCFVYGSGEVYDTFLEQTMVALSSEMKSSIVKEQMSKMIKNVNPQIKREILFLEPNFFMDVKADLYRPATVFLSYLARIHGIHKSSSFDIIEELHNQGVFDETCVHNLRYAVAVACEIRMKAYIFAGSQRHTMSAPLVAAMVGKKSAVDFLIIYQYLRVAAKVAINCWCGEMSKQEYDFDRTNVRMRVPALVYFGYYSEALELMQESEQDEEDVSYVTEQVNLYFYKGLANVMEVLTNSNERKVHLDAAANAFQQALQTEHVSQRKPMILIQLCQVEMLQGNFDMHLKYASDCCEMLRQNKPLLDKSSHDLLSFEAHVTEMMGLSRQNELKFLTDYKVQKGASIGIQQMTRVNKAAALRCALGAESRIKKILNEVALVALTNSRSMEKYEALAILEYIRMIQSSYRWLDDVLTTDYFMLDIAQGKGSGFFEVDAVHLEREQIRLAYHHKEFALCKKCIEEATHYDAQQQHRKVYVDCHLALARQEATDTDKINKVIGQAIKLCRDAPSFDGWSLAASEASEAINSLLSLVGHFRYFSVNGEFDDLEEMKSLEDSLLPELKPFLKSSGRLGYVEWSATYSVAISNLLSVAAPPHFEIAHFRNAIKAFNEAPKRVQNDYRVKRSLLTFLFHHLRNASLVYPIETVAELGEMLLKFPVPLLHPLLAHRRQLVGGILETIPGRLAHHSLMQRQKVILKEAKQFSLEVRWKKLSDKFWTEYALPEEGALAQMHNQALQHFSIENKKICASLLWEVINQNNGDPSMRPKSLELFLWFVMVAIDARSPDELCIDYSSDRLCLAKRKHRSWITSNVYAPKHVPHIFVLTPAVVTMVNSKLMNPDVVELVRRTPMAERVAQLRQALRNWTP